MGLNALLLHWEGWTRQGRAGQGRAGQGRAGQGRAGQGLRQIDRPCLGILLQDVLATMSLGPTLKPCLMPAYHLLLCSAARAVIVDQLP